MSLISTFKEAALAEEAVFIQNYFKTEFTWQNVLDFVYQQTTDKNIELEEKKRDRHSNVDVFGNIFNSAPILACTTNWTGVEIFSRNKRFFT
jgi:hypothetical protein